MANTARTEASWQPNGGQNVKLGRIMEPSVAKDQHGESEALFGIARKAWGFSTDADPSYRATFTVPVSDEANQEYDWDAAATSQEEGTLQYGAGAMVNMYPGKVVSCEPATDAMGKLTWSVTILCLDKQRL